MTHDCGEISSSRGAANGSFGGVDLQFRLCKWRRGPENGFPGIMDGGGKGVFGGESGECQSMIIESKELNSRDDTDL